MKDDLIISHQDGVELHKDHHHEGDVCQAGEDVQDQQDNEKTFHDKVDGSVAEEDCH